MELFLITFGVILFIIMIMSIGVIAKRPPLKGSCGGVSQALGEKPKPCVICGKFIEDC